jgi:hypothetical protein
MQRRSSRWGDTWNLPRVMEEGVRTRGVLRPVRAFRRPAWWVAGRRQKRLGMGITTQYECFDVCSDAWGSLIHHSLPNLITSGTGHPFK